MTLIHVLPSLPRKSTESAFNLCEILHTQQSLYVDCVLQAKDHVTEQSATVPLSSGTHKPASSPVWAWRSGSWLIPGVGWDCRTRAFVLSRSIQ